MPLGNDPEVIEAFEILSGAREVLPDKRNILALARYRSRLRSAMDQAEERWLRQDLSPSEPRQDIPTLGP
jgi:hypothetical protein